MDRHEKTIIALLLAGFVLVLTLSAALLSLRPHARYTLPVHVRVDDYVGINLDTDKLYFGTVYPGGGALRSVGVQTGKDSYVLITAEGQVGAWMTPDQNCFLLEKGGERSVSFSLRTPEETPLGNYTGTVTFTLYRPFVARLLAPP